MAEIAGTAGYNTHAAALVAAYESIRFEDVHRDVLHLIPRAPGRVLDVGAGTGRDAAALARLGHRVVAVEPTPGLRTAGERLHAALPIAWIDDHLPELTVLRQQPERFDLILPPPCGCTWTLPNVPPPWRHWPTCWPTRARS